MEYGPNGIWSHKFIFNTTQQKKMEITIIQLGDENIAEVKGSGVFIHNLDDGLQIMVDCGAQEAYKAIIYQENITDDFFELKTKLAGEILQNIRSMALTLPSLAISPDTTAKV